MTEALEITAILEQALAQGASDIILTVGVPPQFKVHGQLTMSSFPTLSPVTTEGLMYSMMSPEQRAHFEQMRELDFSFSVPSMGRFRVNAFRQRGSVGGVLRLIPTLVKSVEELGLPSTVLNWINTARGLVLITGPTGSGKSTTLAALIDYINTHRKLHIVTIEDPIEFNHTHKNSIVNQREIGQDTLEFGRALRSVLRQAPDVIMVGELRDYETVRMTITAAETGHLVLGTLHTNSAAESIDRLIDIFPAEHQEQIRVQLASTLIAVMTQQLIPQINRTGRVLAYEIMNATPAVRALIREGKTHQLHSCLQTGAQQGMITMDACLAQLYKQQHVSLETALAHAHDSKELLRLTESPDLPPPNSALGRR